MAATQQLCTFYVDDLFLGVEVEKVQEVIRHQETTRVPLAPEVVGGLLNLRGQIVTAIDLRHRLQIGTSGDSAPAMNVVVRSEDGAISLLVDEIGDVVEVEEAQFEPPPDTLAGVSRELIRGAYKLKGRLLLLLETEKALAVA